MRFEDNNYVMSIALMGKTIVMHVIGSFSTYSTIADSSFSGCNEGIGMSYLNNLFTISNITSPRGEKQVSMAPVHVTFQVIIKNCIILSESVINVGISARVEGPVMRS